MQVFYGNGIDMVRPQYDWKNMTTLPCEESIAISQLLLDTANPRLPEIQDSQLEAIRAIAKAQDDHIVALATHLVGNGPNPASLIIVMPAPESKGMYIVLDGNRRISALKILDNPSIVEGEIKSINFHKLKKLSLQYEKSPILKMVCIIFKDREEADTWVELTHRGYSQGAGLVEWDGQVAARYDARKGKKVIELQILDFVSERVSLSEKTETLIKNGRFPVSTLKRLLDTPYVRKKLGIGKRGDEVTTSYPESELLKGLTHIIEELGQGNVTVSKLKSQDQRVNYINELPTDVLPEVSTKLNKEYLLGSSPSIQKSNKDKTKASSRKRVRIRVTLIPRDINITINQNRISAIYNELKMMNLDEFPNSVAIMLRVFIELSLDHILKEKLCWNDQQIDGSKLSLKLERVANYVEDNSIMSKIELAPIRKAISGQTVLVASIKTLHSYVHNRYFSPIPSELKTTWDDIQSFILNIWKL